MKIIETMDTEQNGETIYEYNFMFRSTTKLSKEEISDILKTYVREIDVKRSNE